MTREDERYVLKVSVLINIATIILISIAVVIYVNIKISTIDKKLDIIIEMLK